MVQKVVGGNPPERARPVQEEQRSARPTVEEVDRRAPDVEHADVGHHRGAAGGQRSSQATISRPPWSKPMFGPKFFTYGSHADSALAEGP